MSTFRDELLKEVQTCRRMLLKYEDRILKVLEDSEMPKDQKGYYMERVTFWSSELKDAKTQLIAAKDNVQAMN